MTPSTISALIPGKIIRDGLIRGLHVKSYHSGRKSFFLYYRTRIGTERRPKLGEVGVITLAQARSIAKSILFQVAFGKDPQQEIINKRNALCLNEIFSLCMEKHWSAARYQKSGQAVEVKRNYEKHIAPSFGRLRPYEITMKQIRDWHATFLDTPYAGNRSLEVLSRLFNFAREQEIFRNDNPCLFVKAFKERKRKRYANYEEITAISQYLSAHYLANPQEVTFIFFLMMTGARPKSVEALLWSQIEYVSDAAIIRFEGKSSAQTGELETIVIPVVMLSMLRRLPTRIDGKLFGCKSPTAFWKQVTQSVTGCHDLWLRDWRRTFATIGLSEGVSLGIIGELLNHQSTQTTKTYAKVNSDKRILAVTKIADKLCEYMPGSVG